MKFLRDNWCVECGRKVGFTVSFGRDDRCRAWLCGDCLAGAVTILAVWEAKFQRGVGFCGDDVAGIGPEQILESPECPRRHGE